MKSRKEIKLIGKEAFKANYWTCVLAALLVSAVIGAIEWLANGPAIRQSVEMYANAMSSAVAMQSMESSAQFVQSMPAPESMTIQFSAGSSAASLLAFLISGPVSVGLAFLYLKNLFEENRANLTVMTPFTEAFNNFPRKLGSMLLMGLKVFLWSLLLVIPGIIKSYAYAMTPYILADCPNVKAADAIKLSKAMMKGHKWELFVLGLSYIGWFFLGILTLGIVYLFYVTPWMNSTYAVYYEEVRDEALRTGAVTREQLDGMYVAA